MTEKTATSSNATAIIHVCIMPDKYYVNNLNDAKQKNTLFCSFFMATDVYVTMTITLFQPLISLL